MTSAEPRPRRRAARREQGPPNPVTPVDAPAPGIAAATPPAADTRPPATDATGTRATGPATEAGAAQLSPTADGPADQGRLRKRRHRHRDREPAVPAQAAENPDASAVPANRAARRAAERQAESGRPPRHRAEEAEQPRTGARRAAATEDRGDSGTRPRDRRAPEPEPRPRDRRAELAERNLRGLVSSRGTQVPWENATRAREYATPDAEDLARAADEVVIVQRHYVPPEPLKSARPRGEAPRGRVGNKRAR